MRSALNILVSNVVKPNALHDFVFKFIPGVSVSHL